MMVPHCVSQRAKLLVLVRREVAAGVMSDVRQFDSSRYHKFNHCNLFLWPQSNRVSP